MRPQNPNVRFARVWEWSGFWSLLLVLAEAFAEWLGAIPEPHPVVVVLLAAVPVAIRWLREKATGVARSFRRDPDAPVTPT